MIVNGLFARVGAHRPDLGIAGGAALVGHVYLRRGDAVPSPGGDVGRMTDTTSWASKVFAVNPAGLHWQRGMVLLQVVLLPLVVFWASGYKQYLSSAVFAVVLTAAMDPGGSYRSRVSQVAGFALIGAAVTALGFGVGGDAWGWLVLAALAVTLVAGLAIMFGAHRAVAGGFLNIWFIVALATAASYHQAHTTSYTWAQVLAWAGGAALWIAVTFIAWLMGGRKDVSQWFAEFPGDTSRHPLTRPVIMFAVLRAVVIAGTLALAYGLTLPYGHWMPLAAIFAMKPNLGQTTLVAVQRLVGTLMGAAAAALLLLIPANEHGQQLDAVTHGLDVVAVVLLMDAVAIIFWNFALFTAAIAAATLILVDLSQPTNYSAEGYRVLWTLCGAAIALAVLFLGSLLGKSTAKGQAGQPADVPAQRKTPSRGVRSTPG
jgi:hypothetical protein